MSFEGFKPELLAVKVRSNFKKKLNGEGAVKKTHGRNFDFWVLTLNQRGSNMVGYTLIQCQDLQIKITAVVFFLRLPIFANGAKISQSSDFEQQ